MYERDGCLYCYCLLAIFLFLLCTSETSGRNIFTAVCIVWREAKKLCIFRYFVCNKITKTALPFDKTAENIE